MWTLALILVALGAGVESMPVETQVSFSPKPHDLDQNDNFSPDGRFLCYDTREDIGPGIENCQSIEKIELATGVETVLYRPSVSVTGARPAPGIGAVSWSPKGDRVAFIHGPDVRELGARGAYGKPNRTGVEAAVDGSGARFALDCRDVATDRDTLPGAHRGGTHRHEYSPDGRRIGFTYDDFLLPDYDRTVGYLEAHPKAPDGASHYFAVLVPVMAKGTAQPGELEKAWGDAWAAPDGSLRAFIGKVRNADGVTYTQSLFTVSIPATTDITTADSGAPDRFPAPPVGTVLRRLTHGWAEGIVRGAPDGSRIAYYGRDAAGRSQVFIIASDGADDAPDAAKRPVQVTQFPAGTDSGLRWHPSGARIYCVTNNAIAEVNVAPGADFGRVRLLTPEGGDAERSRLVVSPDGRLLAYNKPVPMQDPAGNPVRNYAGKDHLQIFTLALSAD